MDVITHPITIQGAKMSFREKLSQMWNNVQYTLFPDLIKRTHEICPEYKKLITILELVRIENHIPRSFELGRPPKDRIAIARSFIAKIVLKLPYTKQIVRILKQDEQLRIICGWDPNQKIPSESKFSRAFKEFSTINLSDNAHQALIKEFYKEEIIGHAITDSTSIEVREKGLKKTPAKERRKEKDIERRRKQRAGEPNLRQQQLNEPDLRRLLDNLPKQCDKGMKKNARGFHTFWTGYKLHTSVDDNGIPLAAILTSASSNDCEVAIPLAVKRSKVTVNLYDLMDAAYDFPEIAKHSRSLGHVPIIDKSPHNKVQKNEKECEKKRKKILNFQTAEDKRYSERWPKESFNAFYKDYCGGHRIYYRGYSKVACHVLFGVLTATASLFFKLIQ
jgi:hypothetical protein